MSRPKIVRVWGKADQFDIDFRHKGEGQWTALVPPDTQDGVYAVELWALNEFDESSYWTGELYMCNSVCCLKLNRPRYQILLRKGNYSIELKQKEIRLTIGKECIHDIF